MAQPQPAYVFEVDGDVAVPTELARGPWSPHAQHGGAPAALLAGQLERFDLGTATFPARFTLELMRPVPLTLLRIERQTIRPGKKVQLVQGSLFAGEVEVVRATLLRLREKPVEFTTVSAVMVATATNFSETAQPVSSRKYRANVIVTAAIPPV